MRLTNQLKGAFVNAVIGDVPEVDYVDKARVLLQDHCNQVCPPEVLKAFKIDPSYFKDSNVQMRTEDGSYQGAFTVYLLGHRAYHDYASEKHPIGKAISAFANLSEIQTQSLKDLRFELKALIAGFHTLKAAQLGLPPDLVKYLPKDEPVTQNLPALAETMANLKRMGWKEAA